LSLSKRSVDPDYRGFRDWAKGDVFQRLQMGSSGFPSLPVGLFLPASYRNFGPSVLAPLYNLELVEKLVLVLITNWF
jgi:hypothetical protein